MSYKLNLLFIRLIALNVIFPCGCLKVNEKIYDNPQNSSYKHVENFCLQTDASHFVINDTKLWIRTKDGKKIEMKHINFLLPDGYYFCTKKTQKSTILD